MDTYDEGLLSDFGAGNVEWWQDYIRAALERAHEFYAAQDADIRARLAVVEKERDEARENSSAWEGCFLKTMSEAFTVLAAIEKEIDEAKRQETEWHDNFDALQAAIVGKTGASEILKVDKMKSVLAAQSKALEIARETLRVIGHSTGPRLSTNSTTQVTQLLVDSVAYRDKALRALYQIDAAIGKATP